MITCEIRIKYKLRARVYCRGSSEILNFIMIPLELEQDNILRRASQILRKIQQSVAQLVDRSRIVTIQAPN